MFHRAIIILVICLYSQLFSQIVVSGRVVNGKSGESLSYVNVGIKNKNRGTVSESNGNFKIKIPEFFLTDSLTFFITGYAAKSLCIKDLKEHVTVKMHELPVNLNEIVVTGKKYKETKYGIKKNGFLIHFIDASVNQNDVFEIAQRIKLPKKKSKTQDLNFHVNEATPDSVKLRINFYRMENNKPGERLPLKEILFNKKLTEGWNKFDLSGFNIYLSGEVVAAIEFLPQEKRKPVQYEVKIGANVKSFVRTSSLGTWNSPPHYYCINLTMFTNPDNVEEMEDEEKQAPPAFKMFSEFVKDSFYVFVSVPGNYNKNKKAFAVDYLLDGNAYFAKCSALARQNKENRIIVGVGYSHVYLMDSLRDRDFTFPLAHANDSLKVSGGAEKFYKFITHELIPLIDKTYHTDTTQRTLIGHSLGGYFVLYALAKERETRRNHFHFYRSASPSVEYADNYIFNRIKQFNGNSEKIQLYITSGDKEDLVLFNKFVKLVETCKDIEAEKEIFPGLDHMGAALPALSKSLKVN